MKLEVAEMVWDDLLEEVAGAMAVLDQRLAARWVIMESVPVL